MAYLSGAGGRMNNRQPSPQLSFDDAVTIWGLSFTGMFQNRIAAMFDVNPGRVNEVLKGRRHPGSEAVARRLAQE